ncbi:MAG: Bug family tripartite tricarboxylate transporter substrate binding protein [Burkholderiales bacterium]
MLLNLNTLTRLILLGALVLPSAPASSASTYPTRPIRIVTSEPGGGNDILARIMAEGINSNLPQRAIVDNRGIVAAEIAAKAAPDGHTLLVYGSNIWLMPFLRSKVAWDPLKDFTPVTLAVQLPNILVVHPNMTVKSVKELITLAKSKPGELNYAAGTIGVSPHLAAELFKSLAGVNLTMVPYKGGGPALNGLIGGETNLMFPNAGAVMPHIRSGRVRGLAVSTAKPSALVPDLPTIASTVPGYETTAVIHMFAPSGTPVAIIDVLNRETTRTLTRPEVKDRLFNLGAEVVASTPAQLGAYMRADMAKMGKVIKDAGIHE